MKIFEIVKAPYLKEGGSAPEIMRSLVQDAANLAVEDVLFELIVQGGCRTGDPLRWFISMRCKRMHEQQRHSVETILARSTEERFRSSGYLLEPLPREEFEEATGGSHERICVLTKDLPIYHTALSPMPYVQRPDLFRSKFDEVLSLLDGTQAQIVFQICPTRLTEAEKHTVKERAVSYMNSAQMLMNHDATAAAAAGNWADLCPDEVFALCAVFICGSYEATAGITARLKGVYRQMSGAQVPFCVNTGVSGVHLFSLSELFPDTAEDRFAGIYTLQELGVLCPLPVVSETSASGLEGNVASLLERRLIPEKFTGSKGCRLGICTNVGRMLSIPYSTLNESVAVIGMSGSGKSTVAQMMAENLNLYGTPVVIFTPCKDFRRVARKANMNILRVGEPGFTVNPFQIPRNVALKDYIPGLNDVFEGCISMDAPLPSIVQESISRVYARYNYTSVTKGVQEPFGVTEFLEVLHSNVDDSLYDKRELTGNLKSAAAFRINKLLASCPEAFECIRGVTPEELLEGNGTLVEIDSNDFTARVAVSILMIQLVAYIKATSEAGHNGRTIRAAIIVDEAHRLLDASGSHYSTEESANAAAMTERLFKTAISELRKERVSTILLDQSICRMPPALIDACGTKIFMHLTGTEAEEAARKTGVDPRVFAHMSTGEAVVVSSGLPPTFIQTLDRPNGFLSDSDVATYMAPRAQNKPVAHPFKSCSACAGCQNGCNREIKAVGAMLATKIQVHRRKDGDLTELQLESLCAAIPKILKRHGYTDARLPACTAVHLCARVMRATGVSPRNGVEQMVKAVDEIAKEEGGFYEEGKAL